MANNHVYEPPPSLWKLVEQCVTGSEKHEVKKQLGESLVEQSLELHNEVNILLSIWHDYRRETNELLPVNKFPEPPEVRNRLITEISFFVNSIRDKAISNGINTDKILAKHNRDILEYACSRNSLHSRFRPSVVMSSDGRETPIMTDVLNDERSFTIFSLRDDAQSITEDFNPIGMDKLIRKFRMTLENEISQLIKDVQFLHQCLEDESNFREFSETTMKREPTLSELREERAHLERELLSKNDLEKVSHGQTIQQTNPYLRDLINPLHQNLKIKVHQKTSSTDGVKSNPVKVSHEIGIIASSAAAATEILREPELHCKIETAKADQFSQLVKPGRGMWTRKIIPSSKQKYLELTNSSIGQQVFVPSQPSTLNPRSKSADRFRNMVLSCRDNI